MQLYLVSEFLVVFIDCSLINMLCAIYALHKADSGGAGAAITSQRRISKQAMLRRRSTALNIANTLDALKERQVLTTPGVVEVITFLARDSIYAIARSLPTPVRPSVRLSVRPSVCHTGGSVKDGS